MKKYVALLLVVLLFCACTPKQNGNQATPTPYTNLDASVTPTLTVTPAQTPSTNPTKTPTPTPKLTREQALTYTNLPKMSEGLENNDTTLGMIEREEYRASVIKEKIKQIVAKIKAEDDAVGKKVQALKEKWEAFEPDSTETYFETIAEIEFQGTLFSVVAAGEITDSYKEMLEFYENVYLMMLGIEDYKKEDSQSSVDKLKQEINTNKNFINYAMSDVVAYGNENADKKESADKIIAWNTNWMNLIDEVFDYKWEVLTLLEVSESDYYKTSELLQKYKGHYEYANTIKKILQGSSWFTEMAKG